jgi:hypothetical protein
MRVHTLPLGALNIPMPPLAKIEGFSRLQGGLPPVPYRSTSPKWAGCPTKWAHEPFASKQIRGEVMSERREV